MVKMYPFSFPVRPVPLSREVSVRGKGLNGCNFHTVQGARLLFFDFLNTTSRETRWSCYRAKAKANAKQKNVKQKQKTRNKKSNKNNTSICFVMEGFTENSPSFRSCDGTIPPVIFSERKRAINE